jgi:hypothetical protein
VPYVDSQIPWESHKDDCPNPVAKRLYIRDYDKNGKQRFVPWGITCKNCGIILKQQYEHNLPKGKLKWKKILERLHTDPKYKEYQDHTAEAFVSIGHRRSKEEVERLNMQWRKKRKIQQRKRKMLGGGPMSPKEAGLRRRVKELKRMYEKDCHRYTALKNMINWDEELVEKFLATRPTLFDLDYVLDCPPLYRSSNKKADRFRGYIPDPDKTKNDIYGRQWFKPDPSHYYLEEPTKPYSWRYNPDPSIVGGFEKLVVKEVEERQRWMKLTIKHRQSESKNENNTTG